MPESLINGQAMSHYLRHPADLRAVDRSELKSLLQRYPYSSHLHLMLAIKEQIENGNIDRDLLEGAALHMPDRRKLGDWLNKLQSLIQDDVKESEIAEPYYSSQSQTVDVEEEALKTRPLAEDQDAAELALVDLETAGTDEPETTAAIGTAPDIELGEEQSELPTEEASYDLPPVQTPDTTEIAHEVDHHEETQALYGSDVVAEPSYAEQMETPDDLPFEKTDRQPVEVELNQEIMPTEENLAKNEDLAPTAVESRSTIEESIATTEEVIGDEYLTGDTATQEDAHLNVSKSTSIDWTPPPVMEVTSTSAPPEKTTTTDKLTETPVEAATSSYETPFLRWLNRLQSGNMPGYIDHSAEKKPMLGPEALQDLTKVVHSKEKKKRKKKKKKDWQYQSLEPNESLASEALADLLTQQGHTAKAIEMYEKLRLTIPEKSVYFAQKIEALRAKK